MRVGLLPPPRACARIWRAIDEGSRARKAELCGVRRKTLRRGHPCKKKLCDNLEFRLRLEQDRPPLEQEREPEIVVGLVEVVAEIIAEVAGEGRDDAGSAASDAADGDRRRAGLARHGGPLFFPVDLRKGRPNGAAFLEMQWQLPSLALFGWMKSCFCRCLRCWRARKAIST